MKPVEKVVFFFPWKEISGGPFYLSGLANDLAKDGRYEVWYVDYEDGPGRGQLSGRQIRTIRYTEPFVFPLREPVTLVTPVYCAPHIPALPGRSRIVFLNWHNYCTQELRNLWRLSDRQLQRFLYLLFRRDALFFLDRTHWQAQNEWIARERFRFPEEYVPVKAEASSIRATGTLVRPGEIHAAVLGRLCADKIYSVLNLLEQLERIPGVKHIYLIGSGPEAARIRERRWGVQIHMEGTITGERLQRFLAEKTDLLFSMGMSVLEGARIGLPSVVMPHNVRPFHADAYAYLQESRGYAVGWYDTQIPKLGIPMHPLGDILSDVYRKGRKGALGQAALAYLERNHSANVELFAAQLARSRLYYAEFARFAARQGRVRVCGVPIARLKTSFDGSRRSVSLLGNDRLLQYRACPGRKEFFLLGRPCKWLHGKNEGGKYRLYIGGFRLPLLWL